MRPNDNIDAIINVAQPSPHAGHCDEDVLTITEVAAHLRCSKAHVYNLINGAVPGVRRLKAMSMGRRKVVRWGELKRWKRDLSIFSLKNEPGGRERSDPAARVSFLIGF